MRSRKSLFVLFLAFSFTAFFIPATSNAALNLSLRHEVASRKTGHYFAKGFFIGGDHTVTAAKLKDVRRAISRRGYERIVFDLRSLNGGSNGGVPFFQVQLAPNEDRIILSIWADVMYDFNAKRVRRMFAHSRNIRKLNIVPRLEDGLTIIEMDLKAGHKVKAEAFDLEHPARIILDLI